MYVFVHVRHSKMLPDLYRCITCLLLFGMLDPVDVGLTNNCHNNPTLACIRGGSCVQSSQKFPKLYSCFCLPSTCGKRCQANNPCKKFKKNPCLHKGQCRCVGADVVNYRCTCKKPFTGKHCETLPDQSNPCSYQTNCPNDTVCEPAIIYANSSAQSHEGHYSLGYHCKDVHGNYVLKSQVASDASLSFQQKPCGRKRKKCGTEKLCVNNKCMKMSDSTTQSVSVLSTANPTNDICGELLDLFNDDDLGLFPDIDEGGIEENDDDLELFPDIDVGEFEEDEIFQEDFNVNGLENINNRNPNRGVGLRRRAIMERHVGETINFDPDRGKRHGRRLMTVALKDPSTSAAQKGPRKYRQSVISPCKHGAKCVPTSATNYRCECPQGTKGKNCSYGCPEGTFGPPECKRKCGQCLNDGCDFKRGTCDGKCLPGWRGIRCMIKSGLTVFLTTKFAGTFDKALKDSTSEEYADMKNALTSWILPLCSNDLQEPCSLFNVTISEGSVVVDYEVNFSSEDEKISSKLTRNLKKKASRFNSTIYKVVPGSIEARHVKKTASSYPIHRRRQIWVVVVVLVSGCIFVGVMTIFTLCARNMAILRLRLKGNKR